MAIYYQITDFNTIDQRKDFIYDDFQINDEFVEAVKELLPQQPWSVGIHKVIASQLGCPNGKVSWAIEMLIQDGTFHPQVNGQIIQNKL